MKKVIETREIDSCIQCHNMRYYEGICLETVMECSFTGKRKLWRDCFNGIMKSCPLPDAPEVKR